MSRINLDPLMTFSDGSHLVISTQCLRDRGFFCALYSAVVEEDDRAAFRAISNHLPASTCLSAQEHAYSYALRLYPGAAQTMKKPPYLIWSGPPSALPQ
jgi:hypothetical protein